MNFKQILLLLPSIFATLMFIASSCSKKEETKTPEITVPMVTTAPVTAITQISAESGGAVISDGGSPVTAKGICWSTVQHPTIDDPKTSDGTGTGDFNSTMTGLVANTPYFLRAWATNSKGTNYGNELTFVTLKSITANFTVDKNKIFRGESVQFVNVSTGSPTSLAWSFEEGIPAVSNEANPLVKFSNAGTFKAKLTIQKENESDFKTVDIVVQPFTLSISPKLAIIRQDTALTFNVDYPQGSSHQIQYSLVPNLGSINNGLFTGPGNLLNSEFVVLTANSDLLPEIKDQADIYLVGASDFEGCGGYQTFLSNGIMIENNIWNASSISNYKQCVYHLNIGGNELFAWKWQYPLTATNVNAYPEIVYGWKPWYSSSTTTNLPRQINSITTLKVNYEVESDVEGGGYNLAFDNWITASPLSTPEDIRFEFMIWEDSKNLTPFGDYLATVNTTNGSYKLFKGEPTWEPPGTNWTYLAFKRTTGRTQGVVDVDEMLNYLVNNGIVPANYYLASLELGNEVTSGRGFTVVKKFEVAIE